VTEKSQIQLPPQVTGEFEVYVNGVQQQPGVDFERVGTMLVFERELSGEGDLGFWRWLSLFLGVAGTYRRDDTVDVIYSLGGRRVVATLRTTRLDAAKPA
jgi:hypothetical protein